jgi:hypothetical protein
LVLADNNIGMEGAAALAEALRSNAALQVRAPRACVDQRARLSAHAPGCHGACRGFAP